MAQPSSSVLAFVLLPMVESSKEAYNPLKAVGCCCLLTDDDNSCLKEEPIDGQQERKENTDISLGAMKRKYFYWTFLIFKIPCNLCAFLCFGLGAFT